MLGSMSSRKLASDVVRKHRTMKRDGCLFKIALTSTSLANSSQVSSYSEGTFPILMYWMAILPLAR